MIKILIAEDDPNIAKLVEATVAIGGYEGVVCANGTVPLETLKGGACLWVVTFSAFQTNAMSGHFGGEIRLAYLIEDGRVTPVTGTWDTAPTDWLPWPSKSRERMEEK